MYCFRLCSNGQLFLAAVLTFTITSIPALGNEVLHTLQNEEVPGDVYSLEYNPKTGEKNAVGRSAEQPPDGGAPAMSGVDVVGGQVPQPGRRLLWSDGGDGGGGGSSSGYAAAFDALLAYHAEVQREEARVVDMPDMRNVESKKVLFFTVTTEMSVSGVQLRVPATLHRVSDVAAHALPDGAVDMSCDVRLGDFQTWGQYDVKVNGVGPSGDFHTTISDRVVHATIRFRELPAAATATPTATAAPGGEAAVSGTAAPARCTLRATQLTLVRRGRTDVPAVLAAWASDVEDVPTTLRVMEGLLNERLGLYHCDDRFVALVRRGYA